MPTWVRAKRTVSCRLWRVRLGAFATKHALLQSQKSATLRAFASGAMPFCSSQKTAGAEVRLHKRAQEWSRADCLKNKKKCKEANKGRELFITDFTVTALKPTWKRQAKHSKPRFPECFSNNSSFPVKHSNLLSPVWEVQAGDKL